MKTYHLPLFCTIFMTTYKRRCWKNDIMSVTYENVSLLLFYAFLPHPLQQNGSSLQETFAQKKSKLVT